MTQGARVRRILKKLNRFSPIEVHWIDSFSSESLWMDPDDFDFHEHSVTSAAMRSLGFYVNHDEYNLFLTNSINDQTESIYGVFTIPLVAILSLRTLEEE